MTNTTKTVKCDSTCNHSVKQFGFTEINLNKWHKCQVCNKMQVRNWIMRHQMHCEASARYLNEKKGGLN
jgi:hypothetical protein